MYPNPLKQRIRNGEIILGSGGILGPSPHLAGTTMDAGPDFIWIDSEHMPYGAEALETLPVLIRQRGVAPMIRQASAPLIPEMVELNKYPARHAGSSRAPS